MICSRNTNIIKIEMHINCHIMVISIFLFSVYSQISEHNKVCMYLYDYVLLFWYIHFPICIICNCIYYISWKIVISCVVIILCMYEWIIAIDGLCIIYICGMDKTSSFIFVNSFRNWILTNGLVMRQVLFLQCFDSLVQYSLWFKYIF